MSEVVSTLERSTYGDGAPGQARTDIVLGTAGVVRGQFRGYREEPGMATGSAVEAFAARPSPRCEA